MRPSYKSWLVVLVLPPFSWFALGQSPSSLAPAVQPNFLLDISREFVGAAITQAIDRTDPVHDVILKTRITGTGRTVAKVGAELVPDDRAAVIDVVTTGTTYANTVGVNGPVQIHSDSTFPFQIHQRIYVRPEGVVAGCAQSHSAQGESTLVGITTDFHCLLDRLVKIFALRQYHKSKDKAQDIGRLHAERQLNASAQAEAEPRLRDADQGLQKNLAKLRADGIEFAMLRFSSSRDTVFLRATIAGGEQERLAPAPPLAKHFYLALRVHESAINESAQAKLGGTTISGEQLAEEAKKLGYSETPMKTEDKDFTVTFTQKKPIEVAFGNHGFLLIVRLQEFTSGDNEYDGMNMTVKYKLHDDGGKIKAVREGVIEAFPPGFQPGQKLSARQQAMRTVLQKRFGKFLKEELLIKDVQLPEELAQAGSLALQGADTQQGWLGISWRKAGE